MLKKIVKFIDSLIRVLKTANKRWLFVLIVIILLFVLNLVSLFLITYYKSPSGQNKLGIEEFKDAIVRIQVTKDSIVATGTGFFVSPEYVITAAHVVGEQGTVVQLTNEKGLDISATVISSGYPELIKYSSDTINFNLNALSENDWAILKVDEPSEVYFQLGNSDELAQTQEVVLAGFPFGEYNLVTNNSNIARIEHFYIELNQPADPGFSGGPLIQGNDFSSGKVVGVILMSDNFHKSINIIALPINILKTKLNEIGINL